MSGQLTDNKRWYRYRGPWLIMAGPVIVVVASLITAWLAYRTQDDLVDANYYQSGQSVNQILKTNRYAQQYNLGASVNFIGATDEFSVDLDSCPANRCPQLLILQLRHPAKAESDRNVALELDGGSHYHGTAKLPQAHRWYLSLGDAAHVWRIGAVWNPQNPAAVHLHPLQSVNPEDQ